MKIVFPISENGSEIEEDKLRHRAQLTSGHLVISISSSILSSSSSSVGITDEYRLRLRYDRRRPLDIFGSSSVLTIDVSGALNFMLCIALLRIFFSGLGGNLSFTCEKQKLFFKFFKFV